MGQKNKQFNALTMVDYWSQRTGVTSDADGFTGDKFSSQGTYPKRMFVDEDNATIVDLIARKMTTEVKTKLTDLVSESRDIFALSESELGQRIRFNTTLIMKKQGKSSCRHIQHRQQNNF